MSIYNHCELRKCEEMIWGWLFWHSFNITIFQRTSVGCFQQWFPYRCSFCYFAFYIEAINSSKNHDIAFHLTLAKFRRRESLKDCDGSREFESKPATFGMVLRDFSAPLSSYITDIIHQGSYAKFENNFVFTTDFVKFYDNFMTKYGIFMTHSHRFANILAMNSLFLWKIIGE